MSIDQVFSHIKWVQWIKEKLDVEIQFPIVAANDSVALKLGMLHPGKGTNTVRAVFIVDPESKVRLIMYYPQEVGRNMDEVVRAVKALKDEQTAQKRLKEFEGYDWWFCHKPLEK
jgi:peroxiredoxin (alkyl hydroperoxide reductase subunit C)